MCTMACVQRACLSHVQMLLYPGVVVQLLGIMVQVCAGRRVSKSVGMT